MATIRLNPVYLEKANRFSTAFKTNGVSLSSNAEGLLRLAVESWYEDPPRLKNGLSAVTKLDELAENMLQRILEEEHVAKKSSGSKPVQFHELLYAMARSGWDVIKNELDKGF